MAYQDGDASLLGSLNATVDGEEIDGLLIEMYGTLGSTVRGSVFENQVSIQLTGTLGSQVNDVEVLVNSYVAMYGFLMSHIEAKAAMAVCPDLYIDMEILELESSGCEIGDSMDITRYRGDTYPLTATLGRNGNFNVTGMTFTISTQINNGAIYSSVGTILDATNGIVRFEFDPAAVNTAGEGIYDIQGDDGYIYTYDKGKFILLDDVTV